MADLSEYSTLQQKVISEVVKNDNGFHSTYMIADNPFYEMLIELENGQMSVMTNVSCPLSTESTDYTLNLYYSEEQKNWFYELKYLGEEVRGIVHYNTVFNSMGELSFVILNDNVDDKDITVSLPYSNVLILRK